MSPVQRSLSVLKSVPAILFAYAISLAAFGYAYNANTTALKESNARSAAFREASEAQDARFEEQNLRLRYGLCGLQPYASISTPAPTPSAQTLRDVMGRLTGPDSLNCTPDPNDGQ